MSVQIPEAHVRAFDEALRKRLGLTVEASPEGFSLDVTGGERWARVEWSGSRPIDRWVLAGIKPDPAAETPSERIASVGRALCGVLGLDPRQVAAVCVDCLAELPKEWGCTDCEWIEVRRLCDRVPTLELGMPCARHRKGA